MPGKESRHPKHDRRRINAGDRRTPSVRLTGRDPWAAPNVHDRVVAHHTAESHGKPRRALAAEDHVERSDKAGDSGKAGIVGMVIGRRMLTDHALTLTVEPGLKSSRCMPEPLFTIGEIAAQAHVATSAIRYYERLSLLVADTRTSVQRRYRAATLRRLVFIGMLQDAGLALDDIAGILGAAAPANGRPLASGDSKLSMSRLPRCKGPVPTFQVRCSAATTTRQRSARSWVPRSIVDSPRLGQICGSLPFVAP